MNQLFMFSDLLCFPRSFKEFDEFLISQIYEGEKDDDLFSHNDLKNGGRSYSFYGQKVMEFLLFSSSPKIKVFLSNGTIDIYTPRSDLSPLVSSLKSLKKEIFRNLITDTFACCNDFKLCSEADHCIHTEDRFYNGCFYRKNLEAGLNFYKSSKQEVVPS